MDARSRRSFQRLQAEARRAWRQSDAGRLTSDLTKAVASPQRYSRDEIQHRIKRYRVALERQATLNQTWSRTLSFLEKYARGSDLRQEMVAAVTRSLGPAGKWFAKLISAQGTRKRQYHEQKLQNDLSAALALLGAFSPELLSEEGKRRAAQLSGQSLADLGWEQVSPPTADTAADVTEPPDEQVIPEQSQRLRLDIGNVTRAYRRNDPIMTGEMVAVSSSNVHSIGFLWNWSDPANGTVAVRFLQNQRGRSGPGPLYHYYNVHPDVFTFFMRARSKGEFVWSFFRVRGSRYAHRYKYSLKGIVNGYVPRRVTRLAKNDFFQPRTVTATSQTTGETRTLKSSLPRQWIGRAKTASSGRPYIPKHDSADPNRGRPNRGRPNRGRPQ